MTHSSHDDEKSPLRSLRAQFAKLKGLFHGKEAESAPQTVPPEAEAVASPPDVSPPAAPVPAPAAAEPPIPAASKNSYFHALRQGDVDMLKQVLNDYPDLIREKDGGLTGVHIAAHRNQHECLLLLHQHGADLSARDQQNWTPLFYAANIGAHRAVWALCQCGADLYAEDNNGDTALNLALERFLSHTAAPDFSSITALVSAGHDPERKTSRGHTPASIAKSIDREDLLSALTYANKLRLDNQDIQNGIAPAIRVMTPATIKKRNRPGHNAAGLS